MRSGLLLLFAHLLETQLHLVHFQFLTLVQVFLDLIDTHRFHLLGSPHRLFTAIFLLNYNCSIELDSLLGLAFAAAQAKLAPDVIGVHQLSGE